MTDARQERGAPAPILPSALAALALAGVLAAASCAGPDTGGSGRASSGADDAPFVPPPPQPWTSRFEGEAVLFADEIRIEGPPGLLEHIVLRQEPGVTDYQVRTVAEGLLQELTLLREDPLGDLRGQLDNWSLVAFRRLTLLERPGDVPITVRAEGRAAWIGADGTEQRQARLQFVAERKK